MEITLNAPPALILTVLIGTILPLLVGLVTKTVTNAGAKATILALLAAASGLLGELLVAVQADRPYDLIAGLLTALCAFLVAVGMHFGLWKPTGLSATLQRVGSPIDAGTAGEAPVTSTTLGSSLEIGDEPRHRA